MRYKKLNRKSQLTFFIIIGLIILVIMGFAYYTVRQTSKYTTEKETHKAQETSFDTTSIKSYISSCLEKTTKDGIQLLGKQGGVIHEDQGGIEVQHIFPSVMGEDYLVFNEAGEEIKISYGLLKVLVDSYLCEGTSIVCENSMIEIMEGNFRGAYPWANFPDPVLARGCIGRGCFGKKVFPASGGEAQMHLQLQSYVNNKIDECLDNFSFFEKQGYEIEKQGSMTINITTGEETIIAVMKYPLNIIDTSKKTTKLENFYYDTKVRLGKVYDIARTLVDEDKKSEDFDVTSSDLSFIDEDILITILRAPSYDIAISIEDEV